MLSLRRAPLVLGVIGLLVGVGIWLRPAPHAPRSISARGELPAPPSRTAGEIVAPELAWLGQRGAEGRRIAGRVLHGGEPVASAAVRLATEELGVGEWILADAETDEAGRFDLGVRAATRYRVVGQAEGLAAAGVVVDLRAPDPRPAPDAITIELRRCDLVVSGTVQDAGGGVIRGARVRAGTYASELGVTRSDEQGHYRICLSAGPAYVEASAVAYGAQVKHTRGAGERRIDFALDPESVLAGHVVDSDGAPVAGAVVTATRHTQNTGGVAESDAEGRFRLDGLAGDRYLLVARAGDRSAERPVALASGRAITDIVLTIEPRAPFTGRVVVGGQPTGGVMVTLLVVVSNGEAPPEIVMAVSQADGRFAIAGLPPGKAYLRVDGHRLVSPEATIDLAVVRDVDLVCERLAKVSGRVQSGRAPVGRAEVVLHERGAVRHQVLSQDDGTFSIEGVASGTYEIVAQREGVAAAPHRRPLDVGAGGVANLVVDLDVSASIAGVIVDPNGAGIGGMIVRFTNRDAGVGASDVTAPDGTFVVTGLAEGSDYRAQVDVNWEKEHRLMPGQEWPVVRVSDRTSRVTGVRIVMTPATLTISGRVVRGGAPVAGTHILARSQSRTRPAQSGPDGTFQIEKLFPGTYEVAALGPEGIGTEQRIAAGTKDVRIELAPVGTVEGTLRGFSSPTRVDLTGDEHGEMTPLFVTETTFSVTLRPGSYTVRATAPNEGYATARVTAAADRTSHLTLEALPKARIVGVVTDWKTKAAIPGASCGWSGDSGATAIPVVSDATGHFAFDVPPRRVGVTCGAKQAQSYLARVVTVDLPPGGSAEVAVELILTRGKHPTQSVWLEDTAHQLRIEDLGAAGRAAGLHIGDVLVGVDGRSVAGLSLEGASYLIADHDAATPARLTVERDGVTFTIDVPPEGSLPPSSR